MMKMKNNEGITLIALVITIIVLLILAGVSIAMLTGQNGILTQAQNANIEQSHATIRDSIAILYIEYQIQINTGSTTKLASTEKVTIPAKEEKALANISMTFLDFLKGGNSQGINYIKVDTDNIIDVEALTGSKQSLGNGTETDIYKIEEENGSYVVNYYDKDNQKEEIWSMNISSNASSEVVPTREDFFTFNEETGRITGIVENTSKDPNGIGYYYEGDEKILSEENIVIPEMINGVEVTGIAWSAFADSYNLKSIVIPDTVTMIAGDSFQRCSNLTEIILPEGLQRIESGAFWGCTSLTNIRIPASVTYVGDGTSSPYYQENTFMGCSNLTSIVLGKESTLEIPEDKWGARNATITIEQ